MDLGPVEPHGGALPLAAGEQLAHAPSLARRRAVADGGGVAGGGGIGGGGVFGRRLGPLSQREDERVVVLLVQQQAGARRTEGGLERAPCRVDLVRVRVRVRGLEG